MKKKKTRVKKKRRGKHLHNLKGSEGERILLQKGKSHRETERGLSLFLYFHEKGDFLSLRDGVKLNEKLFLGDFKGVLSSCF